MHDVRETLDGHQIADLDGSGDRHTPKIIPAEVDQHHVLGPLLRVMAQLFRERRVLFRVAPRRLVPAIGW